MNPAVVQVQAPTIDEAILKGLGQLSATRTEVAIEVVDEGSRGVLGIGKRDAVVRLTRLDADGKPIAVAEPATSIGNPAASVDEPATAEAQPATAEPVAEQAAPVTEPPSAQPKPAPTPAKQPDAAYGDDPDELQREAQAAREVVATLLEKMQIEGEIDVEISEPDDMGQQVPLLHIRGDDLSALIGARGAVLNKLQFIARAMVSQKIQDRTRFVLDIGDYRSRREEKLIELAKRTAEKAVKYRRPIALNPMPPHERRIIHMTLRDDGRVTTQSKGEGDRRRVRVIPKGGGRRDDRSRSRQRYGNRR